MIPLSILDLGRPSSTVPHVMLGFNVIAADTG